MNDRIFELAEQAGIAIWGDAVYMYHPKDTLDSTVLAKFTELIVKECAKLNKKQFYELLGVIVDTEENDGFDNICLDTVKRVAEYLGSDALIDHFGVTE